MEKTKVSPKQAKASFIVIPFLIHALPFLEIGWPVKWRRPDLRHLIPESGNTKGGSITVPLTSCLTGLESAV